MQKEVFPASSCKKKGFSSGFIAVYPILMVFFIVSAGWTQTLPLKAHIPWGWINDFEFYENGVFIAPEYGVPISYYSIDENFNLTPQYTIIPGGLHKLSQFCVEGSYLFALDGAGIHQCGTPILFDYEVNETGYEYLGGIEPGGTIWAEFGPVLYHDGSIIYYESGDYYRIDVTQPENPVETGCFLETSDVCLDIIAYQDTLLITARQHGTGFWDGNFRIMRNTPPDPLSSIGTYGLNSYSYTAAVLNVDNLLFTSHNQGLRVYDLSDLGNVQEIYFYPTEWGRCLAQSNEFIIMGCNNGWHVFEYTGSGDIQHLEFYPNDTRVLRMRMKPEEEELWCFVDGGSLGGLVVLDLSGGTGIEGINPCTEQISLRTFPNPFTVQTAITCSVVSDAPATLSIYDLTGRRVRILVDEQLTAGASLTVYWDGCDDAGSLLPGGIYIGSLASGGSIKTCRLTLIR